MDNMLPPIPTLTALRRAKEVAFLLAQAQNLECAAVVAVSNMGKSDLLRLLKEPASQRTLAPDWPATTHLVYIDCNGMLEMSEQGFYEVTLRCILEALNGDGSPTPEVWLEQAREAYNHLLNPASAFHIPLGFNQALTAIVEQSPHRLMLLFDEFDEPLANIDRRVFLNLRALKDQYPQRIGYIVATERRLNRIRADREIGEFLELFAHRILYLGPLTESDSRQQIALYAQQAHVTFDEFDIAFILDRTGGHPGLLAAVCRILGEWTGAPRRTPSEDSLIHREVDEVLARDPIVRMECQRIWQDLNDEEQQALMALFGVGETPDPEGLRGLRQKHILLSGEDEHEPRLFARLFADYVARQRLTRRQGPRGVHVDVEAGEVFVNGKRTEPLTNLEYRLLLLLYGHLGKVCDKYEVVQAVWGEEYIDQVDDARIEKLVSRLRQKIEPDPSNPMYILTLRGRGYKMISG